MSPIDIHSTTCGDLTQYIRAQLLGTAGDETTQLAQASSIAIKASNQTIRHVRRIDGTYS